MEVLKKVATVLASVILWAVILLAALFTFTTLATRDVNNVSNLFGYTPLSVQTESMAPTFNAGDLIIIKKVDPSTLKEGDIITFHTIIMNQYALNTHRIQEINDENGYRSYVTKGDNNQVSDTHIIADGDIVGKYVTKVGGLGKVLDFLSSSTGFLIVIVLPMLIFFIYQVYHLIMVSIQLKKAVAIETAQAAAAAAAAATAGAQAANVQATQAAPTEAQATPAGAQGAGIQGVGASAVKTEDKPMTGGQSGDVAQTAAARTQEASAASKTEDDGMTEEERLKAQLAAAQARLAELEKERQQANQ